MSKIEQIPHENNRGEVSPGQVLKGYSLPDFRIKSHAEKKYIAPKPAKGLITLDWLSIRLSVSGSLSAKLSTGDEDVICEGEFENWAFSPREVGTRFYRQVYDIFHYGEKFGVLQIGARQQTHIGTGIFQIENQELYCNSLTALRGKIEELREMLGGTVISVPRVDIAVDGMDLRWLADAVELTQAVEKVGQDNFKGQEWDREKQGFDQFQMGARSSGRFVVFYNKTREIREKQHKQYISDFHKKNGLSDGGHDVYRLEFRLGWRFLSNLENFTWEGLFSWASLKRLILTASKNCFEFVPTQGDKNKSRRPRLSVLLFSKIITPFARLRRTVKDASRTVKLVVKDLLRQALVYDQVNWQHYLQVLKRRLYSAGLADWLSRKWSFIYIELEREAKIRGVRTNPLVTVENIVGNYLMAA
jgi:hypothetical protein